ncbi:hypothetical protein CDD81_5234 [Ophiocordyceps australis]|uniref:Glutaminase GtaA n=1 Tax=Ophiocordyceps australis TaxID=1399860 RepID=A0A2C5YHW3_9HYPO|nr:hypothetical protein CDD81_5234 [Ophiocordyceps australis]
MWFLKLAVTAVAVLGQKTCAQSTFTPARPPAAPLAVKSPYLNVWLNGQENGGQGGYLAGQWPRFWTQNIQAWQGYIMVDGKPFNWMGAAPGAPVVDQRSLEYTSTQTTFVMNVDKKVEMNINFLTPVYYDDLRRQSITSSYLEVSVRSLDGQQHSVQIYCDVSGEWASGDNNAVIEWDSDSKDGVRFHRFHRKQQVEFEELNEIASWGNWYWATREEDGMTYQTGSDTEVRGQFLSKGTLTGNIDKNYRAINDRWPVFGLSRDMGNVNGEWRSILFTIGHTQENSILFQGRQSSPRKVPSYWRSYFREGDLVSFFYNDYDHAVMHSETLDERVASDSIAAAGKDYATITTLAVRQVFGALGFTGEQKEPLVFLKEISSNSDIQTVDVIFPAFPIMLYLNPELIRYTLDPLLENDRSHYPNNWAQHDLGHYPKALGYPKGDDEPMPLEECGNMIIMMLAYAQRTRNSAYLGNNWDLLEKWAQYLIADAKIPAQQLSTDDFAGHLANQTNLAIKGIIGLEAMARIADATGHRDMSGKYSKIAHDYYNFWAQHGINTASQPPHTTLQYDKGDTYGLLYNIYPDKLLGLNLVPQSVYDMQSDFYRSVANEYGVVLDTRGTLTKTDWEMFAAAVAKPDTRDMFVQKVAKWIGQTSTWRAYTDLYDTKSGGYPNGLQFTARPVIGGVFALLVLP